MDTLQGVTDIMDDLNDLSPEQQEVLSSVISDNEGLIVLNNLKDNSKKLLESVKIPFEEKILDIFQDALIYVLPPIIFIIFLYSFYKVTCCMIKRQRRRRQPPIESVIIHERPSLETPL